MATILLTRVPDDFANLVRAKAKEENRNISNYIQTILAKEINKKEE